MFKLFEIRWSSVYPEYTGLRLMPGVVLVGNDGKRYRVFGFTNDSSWHVRYKTTASRGAFSEQPCDAYGVKLYAIGRLIETKEEYDDGDK